MTESKSEQKTESRPAPRRRLSARRMSMIALALSVAAVVLAIVLPSPSATRTAQASVGGPYDIPATCVHYPGAQVTIGVPGAGTVVVAATVGVGINHTFGINDIARIVLAASSTDCTVTDHTAFISVPATLPSDPFHYQTESLLRPFAVTSGGSHTFYVNGIMTSGAGERDRFDSASLVAVYSP